MELRISQLSKRYDNGVQALDNVTLSIGPGMFGLLGPNGAGKSTLMRTLATLQEADSGSATFDGLDVLKDKDGVRRVLGYLPQEFGLYPKSTAADLLDHFASLKGIADRKQRKAIVQDLLQQTNLYEARNKQLGGFSGGMKQRFGIAQALLGNPKLIIVDEPTAGLDPEERVRFHNLLAAIGENVIVVLSTHIVDDVADLCRNMAIINRGRVLLTGDPLQLIATMKGMIWRKFVERGELESCQQKYKVISTRLLSGKTLIHVHSASQPDPTFEAAAADLEDVYFTAIADARAASPLSVESAAMAGTATA
jgi:ABC-2 type transport system ATP-binding protein